MLSRGVVHAECVKRCVAEQVDGRYIVVQGSAQQTRAWSTSMTPRRKFVSSHCLGTLAGLLLLRGCVVRWRVASLQNVTIAAEGNDRSRR